MTDAAALPQGEAFARIRLLRSPRIGPVSYRQLLARYGSATAALAALPELAASGGRDYRPAPVHRIEREVAAVRAAGARYLFHDRPEYPALLGQMEGAPPILTVRGDPALVDRPCVALVGARNASAAAIRLAREFAHGLSRSGFTVVSGLARGIDGAAHEAALPATIGVIASGIDIAYPPQHAELQERIACEGLLVAEQPPGTEPRGSHFPTRNRIIAGLALGTVVVEAAPRSGSLITARLAAEAGREVMAIPGSPLDARSQGCNQLIREGAILVQNAEDVIELLTAFDGALRQRPGPSLSSPHGPGPALAPAAAAPSRSGQAGVGPEPRQEPPSEMPTGAALAELLSTAPVAIDDLVRHSGGDAGSVQMALLELELAGRLQRHAGGRVSLAG